MGREFLEELNVYYNIFSPAMANEGLPANELFSSKADGMKFSD